MPIISLTKLTTFLELKRHAHHIIHTEAATRGIL